MEKKVKCRKKVEVENAILIKIHEKGPTQASHAFRPSLTITLKSTSGHVRIKEGSRTPELYHTRC